MAPILSPRKRMPELWTQRNPVLVCMSFALYLHVINFTFKCTILPPQFFSPMVPSAATPISPPALTPPPRAPVTTFLILFLLPARVYSIPLPSLLQRSTCSTPRIDSWGLTPSSRGASFPAPSRHEPGRRSRQQARLSANPSPIQPGD